MSQNILITGAAGFIGSSFVRLALSKSARVVILDALTYAGHIENIEPLIKPGVCDFVHGDIRDFKVVSEILQKHKITHIAHFAAESHVDNSITGPRAFVETNVLGTFQMLEAARFYWSELSSEAKSSFRFLHVSTDEVFGELGETGKFSESTPYSPNSPYSASKAGSDLLVRAWHHTYGLPTVITNCSNNYGPRQFPEKLIPRMIINALQGQILPVYGRGANIRDWIHVDDHSAGVWLALNHAEPGSTYCFGGDSERTNLQVVQSICSILDELSPRKDGQKHAVSIQFVKDRLGHDFRYAIDDTLAQKNLKFTRQYKNFEEGLRQTIQWYLANESWLQSVTRKKKENAL